MTVNIVTHENLERFAENSKERFADASHTHSTATSSSAGLMSAEDKQRLDNLVTVSSGESILYVNSPTGTVGTASVTRTAWAGTIDNVSALHAGLVIAYKIPVAGVNPNTGVTLNINSLGEHPVLLNAVEGLGTQYPVGAILILVYDADATATVKIESTATSFTGCWKISNYDSNTTYSVMSAAEATTGTANNARTISASVLNNKITERINEIDVGVETVDTGSANGTISVDGTDVAVKGLGSAAYTDSTAYATSSHTHSYAPIASPALTGTPTAPTAAAGTNTTQIATTAFVNTATSGKLDSSSANYIKSLSISGKTITYTKGDSTTGTLTTQDTTYSLPTASSSTLGGVKVGTNLSISDGVLSATNTTYSAATTSTAGLMSASDKSKLDGIATGANAYSLPTASSSTLGGIKVGSNLSISNGVLSATNTTYSNFVKSGSSAAAGLVPAPPTTADTTKYLREDGTWAEPPGTLNTTGSTNSTSKLFLIGAASQSAYPRTYSHWTMYATAGAMVAVSFQANADSRREENIEELGNIDLSSIKAYKYTIKSNGDRRAGLIAQEVRGVLPVAVKEDDEGYLSLDYNAVVAVLVNEVNELRQRVEALEEVQ